MKRVALVVAIALGMVVSTGADTRAVAGVDQSCSVVPNPPAVRASYSIDQSFTPTGSTISGWEVRFLLLGDFNGPVRSRLVFNPAGDSPVGAPANTFTGSGIVVGEVTNQIKGTAFRSFWQRFELPAPVDVLPSPATGSYSIQVDTPLDPDFKPYGTRVSWWACGAEYAGGAGYHAFTATGTGEYTRDAFGVYVEFNDEPGTHHPLFRQKHDIRDFQFRIYSG